MNIKLSIKLQIILTHLRSHRAEEDCWQTLQERLMKTQSFVMAEDWPVFIDKVGPGNPTEILIKTCLGQDLTSHFIWLSKTMTWHMTGHVMKIYNIPTRNIALTWAPYKSCLCTWMLRLCHRSMMDFIFSILFRVSLAGFEQILQKRPSVFL